MWRALPPPARFAAPRGEEVDIGRSGRLSLCALLAVAALGCAAPAGDDAATPTVTATASPATPRATTPAPPSSDGVTDQPSPPADGDTATDEPAPDPPSRARVAGTFDVALVPEASGIAVSRRDPDLRWLVDDGGGPPVLVALAADGTLRGEVALDEAEARDVEDLAAGPCGADDPAPCLYVADTGDNDAGRDTVRVLRVAEPEPDAGTTPATTLELTIDDGPVDVESLVVDDTATVWALTKELGRTRLLEAVPAGDGTGRLVTRATLPLPEPERPLLTRFAGLSATGADLTPDGDRLLLRTYDQVLELTAPGPDAALPDLATWAVRELPPPPELQGEAVAWLPGADGYVSVGEGLGALHELAPLPGG